MTPQDIAKPSDWLVQSIVDRVRPTRTLTDIQVRHRATIMLTSMIDNYLRKVRAGAYGTTSYETAKNDLNKPSREALMGAVIAAYKLRQLDYMI